MWAETAWVSLPGSDGPPAQHGAELPMTSNCRDAKPEPAMPNVITSQRRQHTAPWERSPKCINVPFPSADAATFTLFMGKDKKCMAEKYFRFTDDLAFFVRYLSMPSEKESAWSATTQKASSHCSVCTITKCLSHLIIYLERKKKKAQQTKLAQPIKERLSNWKLAVISIFAVLICACQCNLCIRKFLK